MMSYNEERLEGTPPMEVLKMQRESVINSINTPASCSLHCCKNSEKDIDSKSKFLLPLLYLTWGMVSLFQIIFTSFSYSTDSLYIPLLSVSFIVFTFISLKTGFYSYIFREWEGSFRKFLEKELM